MIRTYLDWLLAVPRSGASDPEDHDSIRSTPERCWTPITKGWTT